MTKAQTKIAIENVYTRRQARLTHPEGHFDKARRFEPSADEDGGDITHRIRTPSRAWPWSYMTACRAKKHCAVLVARWTEGLSVPADVTKACVEASDLMTMPTAMAVAREQEAAHA